MSPSAGVVSRLFQRRDATTGITIAPLRRRHLRDAIPLERVAHESAWSKSVFEGELEQVRNGSRHYLGAFEGRRLVGYAGVWVVPDPDGDQAHVTNVVVAPSDRRRGVARRLLLDLAREIIARGCVAWTLEVRASGDAAQELYRQFGFAPAGIRRRYYDNREDAIVMWCHDIDTADYAERLDGLARR